VSRWKLDEPSEQTAYVREWSETEAGKEYKERHKEYLKEWRSKNKERYKATKRKAYDAIRLECFEHYGGAVCRCCGETMIEFLHLDHINGDGAQHRRENPTIKGGSGLYWALKKASWPDVPLQVLCANCNLGKRTGKYCPHELKQGIDMHGNPIVLEATEPAPVLMPHKSGPERDAWLESEAGKAYRELQAAGKRGKVTSWKLRQEVSCSQCGLIVERTQSQVRRSKNFFCSPECHAQFKTGKPRIRHTTKP
jgi:hypothetical protein